MTDINAIGSNAKSNTLTEENQKGIENHRKAATFLETAAKHHREAALHHEAGAHEKAALSTIAAQGYSLLASEAQRKDVKQHALGIESGL